MGEIMRVFGRRWRIFFPTVLRVGTMLLLVWNLQLSASPLQVVWTGAGPNNNWSTVSNWKCNGASCAPPMQNNLQGADVIFPAGLSSAHLGPVLTSTKNGLTLDSLSVSGSEFTAFTINNNLNLTINGAMSTFNVTGNGATTINTITNDGILTFNSAPTNKSGVNNFGALALNANPTPAASSRMAAADLLSIGASATMTDGTIAARSPTTA